MNQIKMPMRFDALVDVPENLNDALSKLYSKLRDEKKEISMAAQLVLGVDRDTGNIELHLLGEHEMKVFTP